MFRALTLLMIPLILFFSAWKGSSQTCQNEARSTMAVVRKGCIACFSYSVSCPDIPPRSGVGTLGMPCLAHLASCGPA
jgi:hypothetical protein